MAVRRAHVPWLNASRDIVTLDNNSHYRFADLVWQRGHSFFSDSLRVLTMPAFHGSMLRELLLHTMMIDGRPLRALEARALSGARSP